MLSRIPWERKARGPWTRQGRVGTTALCPFFRGTVVPGLRGGEVVQIQAPGTMYTDHECHYWMGSLISRPMKSESLGTDPGISAVVVLKHPR